MPKNRVVRLLLEPPLQTVGGRGAQGYTLWDSPQGVSFYMVDIHNFSPSIWRSEPHPGNFQEKKKVTEFLADLKLVERTQIRCFCNFPVLGGIFPWKQRILLP